MAVIIYIGQYRLGKAVLLYFTVRIYNICGTTGIKRLCSPSELLLRYYRCLLALGVRWVFIAVCAQKYAERCFDKIRHNAQLLDMCINCVWLVLAEGYKCCGLMMRLTTFTLRRKRSPQGESCRAVFYERAKTE